MKGAEIGSSNIILKNPLGFNRKLRKIALVSSQEKKSWDTWMILDVAG